MAFFFLFLLRSDVLSPTEAPQFVHPGMSSSSSAAAAYLYQTQPPHHHHHHHHYYHHNHHHHLNTINVNMKIVPPATAAITSSPTNTSANANYGSLFPSSSDDQLAYNRNCSSTSTNSSCSSFSNLSCNNNSSGVGGGTHCVGDGSSSASGIKKEDSSSILESLYDEMSYQPNYYTNNGSYQLSEQTYMQSSSSASNTTYYGAAAFLKNCGEN